MIDEVKDDKSGNRLSRIAYAGSFALASNIAARVLSTDSFVANLGVLLVFTFCLVVPVLGVIVLALRLLRARHALRSPAFEWLCYLAIGWVALYFVTPALQAKQFAPLETLAASCERETTSISHQDWNGSVCWDGWLSSSKGPGTCSHHGGIDYPGTREREDKFTRFETAKRFTPTECQKEARGISWLY